ncbi:DEAD/DEAH box helicase family protein [Colwellia sp. BRX10-4]|jgi:hypothetical protein|uniref:DEAD/DEAH box helicase family protein n=1 Tax=Colwellia sp. BRX10-4 TaxID=2759843 RepID=UPI0015F3CAFB|nr:DEAD/DEAH box helicase family protein [Colwellia sp. BRX10-4]MBA6397144.1 DEAD/DEAH box helicase family protein [Colwellia sp. BRX10-4]
MKAQLAQTTYITTGPCIFTKHDNSQLIYSSAIDLDETIKKHKDRNVILIAATARNPYELIEKAYKRGIKVYFEEDLIYDFFGLWDDTLSRELNLINLLSIAHEPIFFDVAIDILFEHLKHKIPSTMDLDVALELITSNVTTTLDIKAAIERFKSLYTEHFNSVCKLIEPDLTHPQVKVLHLSYKNELSDYLINNNGLFILKEAMSAGKTTLGIIPLFEHSANKKNEKALLVAPNISLTRSLQEIIIDNGNVSACDYQHYLDVPLKGSVSPCASLICCVNSAVTNEKFIQHRNNCNTVLIDEVQACLNVFSQGMIGDKKLSQSGKAMKSFFNLLKKPKVLLADALINTLTVQQIIEQTDREITILSNSDEIYSPKKEVHLYERTDHLEQIISQANESHCETGFCDGGQKLSTAYFDIADVIKKSLKGEVLTVNADFLKTKIGVQFIKNPLKALNKATFTLFSPAVTAGQNFPFKQFTHSNLLAHGTISPQQLLQSAGRFRNAYKTQISFNTNYGEYICDADLIRSLQVMDTTKWSEYADELEYVENDIWCNYIIERIVQENIIRQHYQNNTLILFQRLGFKIVIKSYGQVTMPRPKKQLAIDVSKEIRPISRPKYNQLMKKSLFVTDEEKEQIYIFELLDFFNALENPELYQEILTFDKEGKVRDWMHQLHICRHSGENKDITTILKLKQIVGLKVLRTLGLDIHTLEGVYGYKEIEKLERYLRHGKLKLYGKTLEVKKIKKLLFNIPHAKKESISKGAFSKAILAKIFGLEYEIADRDESNAKGQYFYQISTESKNRINRYYDMSL